jgi:hypothetical protein
VTAPETLSYVTEIALDLPDDFVQAIESVEYFSFHRGYDDTGSGDEEGWHGFTQGCRPVNHVGTAPRAPFSIRWDTRMVPDQAYPLRLKAVVCLVGGMRYETPELAGLGFAPDRPRVEMFGCVDTPRPFWSRAGNPVSAVIHLPDDLAGLAGAELTVKVWDGGEGTVREPFKLNGRPYRVLSGRAWHDIVFTRCAVPLEGLRPGANEIEVLSDTEHHGIEVILPGPCLTLRFLG